jgi:hypothetical protein
VRHLSRFPLAGRHGPLPISLLRLPSISGHAALLATALLLATPPVTQAQAPGGPPMPTVPGLQQNDVGPLEAQGDSLFVGPCLNLATEGGAALQTLAQGQPLCGSSPNGAFSLDAEGRTVVAGLGRSAPGDVSAAAGFLISTNGGASFAFAQAQLDAGTPADNTVRYGTNAGPMALLALPVVVPEESAPFAVDYVDSTGATWVAGRASGLRRSAAGGLEAFERIVLPPDSLDAISPAQRYDFALRPQRGNAGQLNHIVSSVLVDETGTVWAGTSAGVNRSRPADVLTFEREETGESFSDRAWRRFGFGNTGAQENGPAGAAGEGLSGNFVPVLAEQPLDGRRNAVWMATRPTLPRFTEQGAEAGVTFTRDGGQAFYRTLIGEQVNAFAFRGETAYAASRRGLFISQSRTDTSYQWRLERDFPGAEIPEADVAKRRRVFAVATTEAALWAGTEDGLLKSTDGGQTWQSFRARVPTDPAQPTEAVPRAATYAYPNPFSPVAAPAGVARIVTGTEEGGGRATVRLYDFAMDFVREVTGECDGDGRCEVAWDGTGADGARVANGVYFYEIEAGGETERGKIMVLE